MSRQPFDPFDFPLDGLHLIEASAGTGKTFSLAGLYLRLLVEKRLDVRDILVMTFTRAATQELRERIRKRITAAALIALDPGRAHPGNAEDDIALRLIAAAENDEPREQIARRLRDAAARMDDATIATIHGFAQQAAQENAFDSGLPFDRGTQVDDPEVHLQAVTDYWRSQVLGQTGEHALAFLELWPEPAALYNDLKPALERPYLDIHHGSTEALTALTARARALWEQPEEVRPGAGEASAGPPDCARLQAMLATAVAKDHLRKNAPLNKAIQSHGSVEALMNHLGCGLAGTAAGHPVLPDWLTDLTTDEGVRRHVKNTGLRTFRPQDLELVHALARLAPAGRGAALDAACATVRRTIAQRKRDARQFSFADMIEALHAAITDPERGPVLARGLRRSWPYALVDEFQDTDPLQYEILRAIYCGQDQADGAGSGLIMIGDPKQAIFAFRGGDVFAYLQAARDADGRFDLETNYRSSQGVLDGIEALFRGPAEGTETGEFLVPDIRFHHVDSGRQPDDRTLVRDERVPPVTVWALPGERLKADDARSTLIAATVSEICNLIAPGGAEPDGPRPRGVDTAHFRHADGSTRPVRADDIAVLVNTNREAADVQRALARRGIGAVCLHRASVFATDQATDLLYVLRAADSAARPETVRAALATPIFGARMADLIALTEDESAWHATAARFQDAHETWRTAGVLAMLEPLLQAAAPRVLALEDGERRMTNYLQLAELLAQAETETFGFSGLIHWLTRQIAHPQPDAEVESQQLKLESDAELVRITTVHRAKGLEYAIVFAPFSPFLGAREPKRPWIYHDHDGRAWLDCSLDDAHKPVAARESRAESLRLLYVALTRAQDACYLAWGSINGAQNSALAWLLHAGDGAEPAAVDRARTAPGWLSEDAVGQRLRDYADRAAGAVRIAEPPAALADGFRAPPGVAPRGQARTDLPAARPDWSVLSFSRLIAGGRHRASEGAAADEALVLPVAGDEADARPMAPTTSANPLQDPIPLRGPAFGTAIHQLLEDLEAPAEWPGPGARPGDAQLTEVARQLKNGGLPLGEDTERQALLASVCRLISRTLHTPLPEIGPLARVPAARRLVEMEFYLGLGGERVHRLLEILNAHGYSIDLPPERARATFTGLLQGYVDLIVEAGGRYWIVDYKTNDLGPDKADYARPALARAVRTGHYDLQYLIYLVALHRHLSQTLDDYDPTHHLAGAQYLFLRGLDGASTETGVFVDSPDPELVTTLDLVLSAGMRAAP
jgi:exodeoxyribonuclease V beta subunit